MEKYKAALDNLGTLKSSFDKAATGARHSWSAGKKKDAGLYEGLSQKMDAAANLLKAGDGQNAMVKLDETETALGIKQSEHIEAYNASWYGKEKKNIKAVSHYRTEVLRIKELIQHPA